MKRLPGVVFAAVVLLIGSLFQLLMAALMAFTAAVGTSMTHSSGGLSTTTPAPTPAWMPMLMYGMCAFFVLLALWGILTTVGLLKMRRWARYSVLVIGVGLALIGLPSMLMMLVMTMVSLPPPATMDPTQVHTYRMMAKVGLGMGAAFYAIMSAVGISWLVYFNRKAVRAAFAEGMGQVVESRRPFLISVVAVLMLVGGPSCLAMALLPLPGAFLGLILHGWEKAVFYLGYGALLAVAGVGLWWLKEWGRRLALAMQMVGLVQFAVYVLHPSLMTKYTAEINGAMGVTQAPMPAQFQNTMNVATFGLSALFLIGVVVVLHYYRGMFRVIQELPLAGA